MITQNEKSVARKMEEELGNDLHMVTRLLCDYVVKPVARIATKAAVYPLAGNLSLQVKVRLEDKVGTENFNAGTATKLTYLTNPLIYLGALRITDQVSGLEDLAKVGLTYTAIEIIGRLFTDVIIFQDRPLKFFDSMCLGYRPTGYTIVEAKRVAASTLLSGSLIGKLISLPIEYGMSLYDRATGNWRDKEKKGQE